MSDWHMNIFRPYHTSGRDEISVTRSFVICCLKSRNRKRFLRDVLGASGLEVPALVELTAELEVPAESIRNTIGVSSGIPGTAFVLCISPEGTFTRGPWRDFFPTLEGGQVKEALRKVVTKEGQPDLEAFEAILKRIGFEIDRTEEETAVTIWQAILLGAYWDVWRLLHAGARPDAVLWGDDLVCLVESKIWGAVPELQARNHSQKAFDANLPIFHLTWQRVHDIATNLLKLSKGEDDEILADFRDFLSDFPQLVRWNGFDENDLQTFCSEEDSDEARLRWNRLSFHFWQCMEYLASTSKYNILSRRADDWDFSLKGLQVIGNTGIGWWQCDQVAIKWCVGQKAWETDALVERGSFSTNGRVLFQKLVESLLDLDIPGISIQPWAVQRFYPHRFGEQAVNSGGERVVVSNGGTKKGVLQDAIQLWDHEYALFRQFLNRHRREVGVQEALVIWESILKIRGVSEDSKPFRSTYPTWRLYAAFNVFVWLDPNLFFKDSKGVLKRDSQLERLEQVLTIVSTFAHDVSILGPKL